MKNILAIVHDIHAAITDTAIHETLTQQYGACHFEAVRFNTIKIEHGANSQMNWQGSKAEQERIFENEIKPAIEKNPEREIVYFGLAPIPLCIHLGYLINATKKVKVFLLHHDNKNWHWSGEKVAAPIVENLPNEQFDGDGNIIIRFGTYAKVDPKKTQNIVEDTIKEIDIYAKKANRDFFGTEEDVKIYISQFRTVLDRLHIKLPKANSIHLFAAVPCGLAFLMGQEINSNIHFQVHTYQYDQNENPAYDDAFIVQEESRTILVLTEKEKAEITKLRKEIKKYFEEEMKFFLQKDKDNKEPNWFKSIFPDQTNTLFTTVLWNNLKKINETVLSASTFTDIPHNKSGSRFLIKGEWYMSTNLLYGLNKKFNKEELLTAIRLFMFHEAIHDATHNIHSENANGLRRYPRVLEEADYQADIYAMLYEYKMSEKKAFNSGVPEFFANLIRIATETMMVFDELQNNNTMETRRVNRYLIWFFQLARIENPKCKNREDVLTILGQKPTVDLKLSIRKESKERVLYNLKKYKKEDLGLAVFYADRVRTYAENGAQMSLDNLVDGIRTQKANLIKEVMRQLYAELN